MFILWLISWQPDCQSIGNDVRRYYGMTSVLFQRTACSMNPQGCQPNQMHWNASTFSKKRSPVSKIDIYFPDNKLLTIIYQKYNQQANRNVKN